MPGGQYVQYILEVCVLSGGVNILLSVIVILLAQEVERAVQ